MYYGLKKRKGRDIRRAQKSTCNFRTVAVNCSIHHTDRSIELHYDGRSSREAGMINIMSAYELLNNRTSPRLSRDGGIVQRERGKRHRETNGVEGESSSRHKYARAK